MTEKLQRAVHDAMYGEVRSPLQPNLPPLRTDVRSMIDALGQRTVWTRFASFHPPEKALRLLNQPVEFDIDSSRLAGQYRSKERTIRLNVSLRARGREKDLIETFLHELAHAADHAVNGRANGHSADWCALMGQLGLKPQVHHSINLFGNAHASAGVSAQELDL